MRTLGYSISDQMKASFAVDALASAVARRGGRAVVLDMWFAAFKAASSGRSRS